MRVLWLCNIMLPSIARQLNIEASNKEGWLSGLAGALLEKRHENGIELSIAFPMQGDNLPDGQEIASMRCYGFPEDVRCPEKYDENLEPVLKKIVDKVKPDIVHCFGTEYPHTLAMCRVFPLKERLLVGLQGLCTLYAEAYFADMPDKIVSSVTFRDWLKQDSLKQQQEKFVLRGKQERESICLAGNVTGRTQWDRESAAKWNPHARYFLMNETLRPEFYGPVWQEEDCIPHSIFLSQGDYPIKGLHYMLLALPAILARYPDAQVYVAGNSLVGYRTLRQKLKLSAYGKYLRKLLKQGNLEGKVTFLGKLNAEQMRDRYLKSSLFVCPSSLENSPNSLGEAMLLGMPCVCAAVGGIPSMFVGGEDGILYDGFVMPEDCVTEGSGAAAVTESRTGDFQAAVREAGRTENSIAAVREDIRTEKPEMAAREGIMIEKPEVVVREAVWTEKSEAAVRENNGVETSQAAAGSDGQHIGGLECIARNLAHAVLEMWDNPEQQRIYCRNARGHAQNTHNREKNYARLIEIYSELTAGEMSRTGRAMEDGRQE